jgi:RNA polymerase sigma factor (sigma-70 family)
MITCAAEGTRHEGDPASPSGRPQPPCRAPAPTAHPRQAGLTPGAVHALAVRATGWSAQPRPRAVPDLPSGPVDGPPPPDERISYLLQRAADGDHAAWDCLVEQYSALLWSVVRSFRLSDAHAADAVQTTWLRLVENLHTIREPERLAGWLRTTARRVCLEVIRRAGREYPTDSVEETSAPVLDHATDRPDDDPEGHVLRQEGVALVRRAVRELPERQQRLLSLLVASPPLSYQEIGARLGMPVGSIGPTRARVLARLRTALAPAMLCA